MKGKFMGKIGLEYSECNNLIKKVKKCKDNIEKERKAVEKAISELNDISSGYSELNNIKYNLERIKSKNKSEEDKLQRFETALKNYFANIKDNDTTVYKMS